MQVLAQLRQRFVGPLESLFRTQNVVLEPTQLQNVLGMIRPAQNPQFGDYQANFAMPLSKTLQLKPQEIAQRISAALDVSDVCSEVSVAGPGFINLRLSDAYLSALANTVFADSRRVALDKDEHLLVDRLGMEDLADRETIVVDFSSPNVAKPMHVGHIRSTVIGDSLAKICRYLGQRVITDNHLGDWGTQFGMIIYGFRQFGNAAAYKTAPVAELSRIYRYVRQLMDLLEKQRDVPKWQVALQAAVDRVEVSKQELSDMEPTSDKAQLKAMRKRLAEHETQVAELREQIDKANAQLEKAAAEPHLQQDLQAHADIHAAVLAETSKLHAGDEDNVQFWREILPNCHDEIARVYQRLQVEFDHCLGESSYHDQLANVVQHLREQGLLQESDGAQCVFLPDFEAPMIVQKRDGAFLYATTDLATIQYRMQHWQPSRVLYVVDHRQKEHFDKLFAVARGMGYGHVQLVHVSFGTVMGPDGKPYKTREGDTVGLEGLIDDAVSKALEVVSQLDAAKPSGPEFSEEQRRQIAEVVGVGALKYGDLSQNRSSDYKFDFNQMVALEGNTSTYLQYSFARVGGIFARVDVRPEDLRKQAAAIRISNAGERAVVLNLLRFQDALEEVLFDYRPNLLCNYLFELTQDFFSFYNRPDCRVEGADAETQASRLAICDLMARTVKTGLALLGIQVVAKM